MKAHRQITGKKGELKVMGKLLELEYPVYIPLVDIEGVDCIIRNSKRILKEIQVKSVGHKIKEPYKCNFSWDMKPRKNLYFIFYIGIENSYWRIPSEYLAGKDGKKIYGPNERGRCTIDLKVSTHRDWYKEYKDNWKILEK